MSEQPSDSGLTWGAEALTEPGWISESAQRELVPLPDFSPKRSTEPVILPSIWRVLGDCRCLFRAVCRACDDENNDVKRDSQGEPVADSMRVTERKRADDLRADLCTAMKKRSTELSELLADYESVDKYIKRMRDWRTWGDAICLHFLPDLIHRPIQVYSVNTELNRLYDAGLHVPRDRKLVGRKAIVLWYDGHCHYDLVSTRWLSVHDQELRLASKGGEALK
eukprot:gnl/TRDRNA2_/TRDRNA2_71874_c1_seq1.p1 gnl/TRDRNA2_/TRDRNA2_71874_c1~~gnl/TRDRNA2_/TRDRNA2_71874_c1_seq1.p1  ORF type:complete len:252 (+),score=46.48 gnl/TRDRNA2_/TRDRNA2_71874_c1_seq1:88-756(+)